MIKGLEHNERQIRSMEVCNKLVLSGKNAVLFAISTVLHPGEGDKTAWLSLYPADKCSMNCHSLGHVLKFST